MSTETETSAACARTDEHLADLLDGTAGEELLDHLAECDRCRDLRHDAEKAQQLAEQAGDDYEPPADLEQRILAALDASDPQASKLDEPEEQSRVAREGQPRAPALRTKKPAEERPAKAKPAKPKLDRRIALGAGGLAAAAAIAFLALRSGDDGTAADATGEAWRGEVVYVSSAEGSDAGLEICNPQGVACRSARVQEQVPAGSRLRTNGTTRARLRLTDQSEIVLDRSTELTLGEGRSARLGRGALIAEVTKGDRARFELPLGEVRVLGTKLSIRTEEDAAAVDVSRGKVELADKADQSVTVRAGEEGRLYDGMPPFVTAAPSLADALAWGESALRDRDKEPETESVARGLGELKANKPGKDGELAGAVTLTSHAVKVRIAGAVARTEIDEVFTNHTDDVLEGVYRFPVPPDAKIERLALEVDGKLEEGAFLDRDRAAAIWRGAIVNAAPQIRQQIREEIVWVPGPWKDPALLEWQRGGRFELRIYPIPKKGSRRVVLAYTQVIPPSAGARRYSYALAHDPSGSTKVDRFSLDVQVRGHDPKLGVRAQGYNLERASRSGAEELALQADRFVPAGDLVVEYALPNRNAELTAWAYRDAKSENGSYAAVALRPKLPRISEDAHRAFVVVVDSSRSMFGEGYRRASKLAVRMVRELDPLDQVTVLACDVECRELPGGLKPPGAELGSAVERFLSGIAPEGGSDVTAAVTHAVRAARGASGKQLRVVYVGDGTPTVGPVRPGLVSRAVEQAMPPGRGTVTAVAVGADSDLDTLSALARGGGGVVLPYVPGEGLAETAYAALGATYGKTLRDVRVELPAGLSEVAPRRLDTIVAGSEAIVTARMTGAKVDGDVVLRGKLGDRPFEQRLPLKLEASGSAGNAFVPRLFAAARIADLERDGDATAKKEAIELSQKFNVASRYTSLLVLESPAMFRAFGLKNERSAPEWTGEEEADASVFDDDAEDGESADKLALGFGQGGGGFASGRSGGLDAYAGGGEAPRRSSAPRAAAPALPAAKPPPKAKAPEAKKATAPSPAPAPQATTAAPASRADAPRDESRGPVRITENDVFLAEPPMPPRRRMIPMRRIWERVGAVVTDRTVPKSATLAKLSELERELERDENRREVVKKLFALYSLSGDVERARTLAERWSSKEPLDPEALTARADLAARSGDRDLAIRILGSVVDVRPDDVKSQQRLVRLHRWAGRAALGCRHALALAQLRSGDAKLLADAVACARETGESLFAEELLLAADAEVRKRAEPLIVKAGRASSELSGDFRIEGSWRGGETDVDLSILTPEGHRVSWLGAPTRSVISANDVISAHGEGLGLRGAAPGEYVVEVVRASGSGEVRGELVITIAGTKKSVPFVLDGDRRAVAVVSIRTEPRLVPL